MTKKEKNILKFLEESNLIESVHGQQALNQAKLAWDYLLKQKKLTSHNIKKTHKILMIGQPIHDFQRGYWRKQPVYIGGREARPWFVLPELMENWVKKANKLEDPVEDHISFEGIHPFIDGNGRVGRLLMLWQRVKCGLSVEIIFAKDKSEYYKWFQEQPIHLYPSKCV